MPQFANYCRLLLLRAACGVLGVVSLAVAVGLVGLFAPQHAAASQRLLGRLSLAAPISTAETGSCSASHAVETTASKPWQLLRSYAADAPLAAVSSTPFEAQHPEAPVEQPETGMGSIDKGDDLSDFEDFAYQLRVVFDGTAQLNRVVERGVSLGGRALSRLEDNRSDKPPRG